MVLQTFDIRVCGNFCCCTLISTSEALISHEGIIALNNLPEELIYYAHGEGILGMLTVKIYEKGLICRFAIGRLSYFQKVPHLCFLNLLLQTSSMPLKGETKTVRVL